MTDFHARTLLRLEREVDAMERLAATLRGLADEAGRRADGMREWAREIRQAERMEN